MIKKFVITLTILVGLLFSISSDILAQDEFEVAQSSLYDVPPRWLVDMPTAGTLHRGYYNLSFRFYPNGGALGYADIGLSNRFMMGISFGGEGVISDKDPDWNPSIEFGLKFRLIDEMEYFPAVSIGFSSQGSGEYDKNLQRYAFKSRGFYAVASRSFYFYQWTAGWHAGVNYSRENKVDEEKDVNVFAGFDATFKYNLALMVEYDIGLNDDRSTLPIYQTLPDEPGNPDSDSTTTEMQYDFAGQGRGYFNVSIKWLFAANLELEVILKDLFVNRRESDTFTRELRITYIDSF